MSHDERLLDLLTAQATEGLSEEETRELRRLLGERTDVDADDLDLAAAAVDLAFAASQRDTEPMPADLARRIVAAAPAHLPPAKSPDANGHRAPVLPMRDRADRGPGFLSPRYLGWYAAAAVLVIALWAPWSPGPEAPTPAPTPAAQRAALIEEGTDVIQVAWAPPEIEGYTQVKGDVVWSNARQTGFMRLRGLPANRSAVEQYQLWIVDPTRDERPIDGGVFDIAAGADEVIVPIDAKLRVNAPQAFALTLEQAGGVVVSDGPLLVVAPVQT